MGVYGASQHSRRSARTSAANHSTRRRSKPLPGCDSRRLHLRALDRFHPSSTRRLSSSAGLESGLRRCIRCRYYINLPAQRRLRVSGRSAG